MGKFHGETPFVVNYAVVSQKVVLGVFYVDAVSPAVMLFPVTVLPSDHSIDRAVEKVSYRIVFNSDVCGVKKFIA